MLNQLVRKICHNARFRAVERRLRFTGQRFISLGDTVDKFFRPGWECVDLAGADIVCDLRQGKLPFRTDTIDAFHSSHLIEHLEFDQGKALLRECFRCMKSGGVIRFATPDLNQLIGKFQTGDWQWFLANGAMPIFLRVQAGDLPPEHLLLHNLFIGWLASYSGRMDKGGGPLVSEHEVKTKIETLGRYDFRNWCVSQLDPARVHAHVHVYDYDELHGLFALSGFRSIRPAQFGDSRCRHMSSPAIDRPERAEYSLYIEAVKP